MDKCKVFVVYDRNVSEYALQIAAGRPSLAITADEDHKSVDTVTQICRWLLSQGADRSAVLYAVGGGVTTDMVGMAAALYKRGICYVNYPTTLLAMVDAAIGGKTGVNLDSYKNMIGAFHMPLRTEIDARVLATLPVSELRSGAAEMLKSFIIDNREGLYRKAVEVLSGPFCPEKLEPLIKAAGDVKRRIVEEDPYEGGLRMVLNLGHSFGHAIEWWQRQQEGRPVLPHGQAVAAGIIEAARISARKGLCDGMLVKTLIADFKACGLETELPCPVKELLPAVAKDKKADGGEVRFILIKEIGKVEIYGLHIDTEQDI